MVPYRVVLRVECQKSGRKLKSLKRVSSVLNLVFVRDELLGEYVET